MLLTNVINQTDYCQLTANHYATNNFDLEHVRLR